MREEWGGECLPGTEFQYRKFLEMDGGDGSTTICVYFRPLNCTLKKSYHGKSYVMHIYQSKKKGRRKIITVIF